MNRMFRLSLGAWWIRLLIGVGALLLTGAQPQVSTPVEPGVAAGTVGLSRLKLILEARFDATASQPDSVEIVIYDRHSDRSFNWVLPFTDVMTIDVHVPRGDYDIVLRDSFGRRGETSLTISDAMTTRDTELRRRIELEFPPAMTAPPPPDREPDWQAIFFATNRDRNPAPKSPGDWFTGDRSDVMSYGACMVSFPYDHKIGKMERPEWWKFEFKPDPQKHVTVRGTAVTSRDSFFLAIREELEHRPGRRLLLFVHGYNVDFDGAVRTTAQLAFDMKYDGAPVLYTWPSRHKFDEYRVDQTTADVCVEHFATLLEGLSANTGAERIEILAHSMGNRIVTEALGKLRDRGLIPGAIQISELVCAAPDVDADLFRQFASRTPLPAKRLTLYGSSRDLAIKASRSWNGAPRAGDGGRKILVMPGVETIDVSRVNTDFLDHAYINENRSVISDLHLVLKGLKIADRCCLRSESQNGHPYWVFKP